MPEWREEKQIFVQRESWMPYRGLVNTDCRCQLHLHDVTLDDILTKSVTDSI